MAEVAKISEVDIGKAVKDMMDESWSGMKKVEELGMRSGFTTVNKFFTNSTRNCLNLQVHLYKL